MARWIGDALVGLRGIGVKGEYEGLPYSSGSDARQYVSEVVVILGLASAAFAGFVADRPHLALPLALVAAVGALVVSRSRGKRVKSSTNWFVNDWNERGAEMEVFRLRYMKAALVELGAPVWIGTAFYVVLCTAVVIAIAANWRAFF